MKTNLVLVAAISGALLAAGSAVAADMAFKAPPAPPSPAPTWTGFYIGANGGWGWANTNATVSPHGSALLDFGSQTIGGNNANGAVFGGQVGYNWQFAPAWVLGIEGDVDGSGAGNSHHVTTASGLLPLVGGVGNDGIGASSRLDYLALSAAASATFGVRA